VRTTSITTHEEALGGRQDSRGLSWRAVLLAFAILIVIAPMGFYGELMYKAVYDFGGGAPAVAPLAFLFLLTALNPRVRRLGWRPFSRRELLAVYVIVLIGAPLISHGCLPWLIPYNVAQRYSALAVPVRETPYLRYLPNWFGPTDRAAIENYYVGGAAVPWALWWTPLAAWLSFFLALVLCPMCLIVLLRRQWISHERLAFPIAQVPLEMVQEPEGRAPGARFRKDSVFWIGVLIPFAIGFVNKLSTMVPAIPSVPISGVVLKEAEQTGVMAGLGRVELVLLPWLVAIAYLIPKDLSFSCWFFWFVQVAMVMVAISFGATAGSPEGWYTSDFPAVHHQGGGVVLTLTGWAFWAGRHHLRHCLRLAFGRPAAQRPTAEAWVYRSAIIGFVVTFTYMVVFCVAAGTRAVIALPMVGLIVTYYLMWARLRAETGLSLIAFPFRVDELLVAPLGNKILRDPEVVMLFNLRWSYFPGFSDSAEATTGNAIDGFKVADSARIGFEKLLPAMLVGFVLSMAVVTYVVLTGMYHYGFQQSGFISTGWLGPQLSFVRTRILDMLVERTEFDPNAIAAILAGGVIAVALSMLRLAFWWWPLHPIGYLAATCWGMHTAWIPFFVGWLSKVLVVRFGGLKLYRRTLPIAVGLIVGDMVSQGFWVIVSLLTRGAV
jgi:hypothetical protein